MKETAISVTEAARNFADCVNLVRYQNVSFVLLKYGKPVARLSPESGKVCTGRDLAEALSKVELTANEARAWRKDISAGAKLSPPKDKWE